MGDRGHNRHGLKEGGAVPLSRSAGNPYNCDGLGLSQPQSGNPPRPVEPGVQSAIPVCQFPL